MGYQKRVTYRGKAIDNYYSIDGTQRIFYSTTMYDGSVYIYTKKTIYENIEDEEFIGGMLGEILLAKTARGTTFGGFCVYPFSDRWVVIYVEGQHLKKVEYDLFFEKIEEVKTVYYNVYRPQIFKKNDSDAFVMLYEKKHMSKVFHSLDTTDFNTFDVSYFYIDPNAPTEYYLINKPITMATFLEISTAELGLPE